MFQRKIKGFNSFVNKVTNGWAYCSSSHLDCIKNDEFLNRDIIISWLSDLDCLRSIFSLAKNIEVSIYLLIISSSLSINKPLSKNSLN